MKRYFHMPEQDLILEFDIVAGSKAALASAEEIASAYKLKGAIREIERNEYSRLCTQNQIKTRVR